MEYEFKRPELEDQELISSYFAKAPGRSCERTFVNVYLWSRHYKVKFAVIEDALVFRDEGDGFAFSYPAGEDEAVKRALEALMEYCRERECPFRLYNVTEEHFAQLDGWFPGRFEIQYNRDAADYVYETEKLAALAGKKLHGKRNHINKFKNLYPDWTYESLNESSDTFVVHIEKAFPDVEGAYPMINQQFVQHECMDYLYVNREEDTGAEGLRKAKLSYRPVFLVNKGIVTEKAENTADTEE